MSNPGQQPLPGQNRQASPCPECGTARVVLNRAVEFWVGGSHTDANDPDALVCPRCGHITFYASPAMLAEIRQSFERNQPPGSGPGSKGFQRGFRKHS